MRSDERERHSPEDALLNEFVSYYNADELPDVAAAAFARDQLPVLAQDSARRLRHYLGPAGAAEAGALLRAMADDRDHPLLARLCRRTMFGWWDVEDGTGRRRDVSSARSRT